MANGSFSKDRPKDEVASIAVMERSDGSLNFLDGQNIFDVFIPASESTTAKNMTEYDVQINDIWRRQVGEYTADKKSRAQAIEDFKRGVKELSIDVE